MDERLRFLTLSPMPAKRTSWAILRITSDVSARCSGCGEDIEASELSCEVTREATQERPDLRFHHRCYRTWCALEAS